MSKDSLIKYLQIGSVDKQCLRRYKNLLLCLLPFVHNIRTIYNVEFIEDRIIIKSRQEIIIKGILHPKRISGILTFYI